jgi:hypothetical protein
MWCDGPSRLFCAEDQLYITAIPRSVGRLISPSDRFILLLLSKGYYRSTKNGVLYGGAARQNTMVALYSSAERLIVILLSPGIWRCVLVWGLHDRIRCECILTRCHGVLVHHRVHHGSPTPRSKRFILLLLSKVQHLVWRSVWGLHDRMRRAC